MGVFPQKTTAAASVSNKVLTGLLLAAEKMEARKGMLVEVLFLS